MLDDAIEIMFKFQDYSFIKIYTTRNEIFKNILEKFKQKSNEDPKFFSFYYGAKQINENQTIAEINNNDKNFTILAISEYNKTNENSYKKSKNIICPKCQKHCIINFENYKISLEECDNNHYTSNILFEEFEKTQLINQSKIKCEECPKNRTNIINNNFYKCFTCNKNLCPECKEKHINSHYIIDYDKINYFCNEHKNNQYEYYCKDCHKNLCSICRSNHKKHNIINIHNFNCQDRDDDQKNENVFNVFKNEITGIKNMLDVIINNFEIYFKIIKEIKDKYDNNNMNYQIYQNMNNITNFNNDIIKEMKNIIFEKNINDKLYNLYKIYTKIIKKDNIMDANTINDKLYFDSNNNEIEIKYIYKNKNKFIKLFGEEFIFNNKDKCVMKYKNNQYNLQNNYDKSLLKIDDDNFTIKLQLSPEVTDLSYMFDNCSQLIELPDIHKLRTEKVANMSYMFNNCTSLSFCKGISNWNTSNVTNMSNMFSGCNSLPSLPDISKWNTTNVKNMNFMFFNCKSLTSFPEINKWNTNNLKVAISMFGGCDEKVSLPDISLWKISPAQTPFKNDIQENPNNYNLFFDLMKNNEYNNQFNFGNFLPNNCNMNNINMNMNNINKNNIDDNNLNNNNMNNKNNINMNNNDKNHNKNSNNYNNPLENSNNYLIDNNGINNMNPGPVSGDIKIKINNSISNIPKKEIKSQGKNNNKKDNEKKNSRKKSENKNNNNKIPLQDNNKNDFYEISGIIPGIKRTQTIKENQNSNDNKNFKYQSTKTITRNKDK